MSTRTSLPGLLIITFIATLPATGFAAQCTPTPHRTTGTHYEPVTEQKVNVGKGVIVRGRILAAPDCTPVANAKVAHWQAGESGEYTDPLRAYMFSATDGSYEFETEWPNMFAPHIHFIITTDDYQTLETQWVGNKRTNTITFDMVLQKK